jgi:predicted  nucleic acid-binding Zn-ribbon protein
MSDLNQSTEPSAKGEPGSEGAYITPPASHQLAGETPGSAGQSATDQEETVAPQSQATGTPAAGTKTNNGQPKDPIAEAEEALKQAQKKLDAARKNKADDEKIQKDRDAIKNQRAISQVAVTAANTDYERWKKRLEDLIPEAERAQLDKEIKAVNDEVAEAERDVTRLKNAVAEDETVLATANSELAALETQYADKQKELNQLTAKIKDVQSRIDKLRTEVKAAIDAKDWSRAYYKNYRLKQALDEATPLLDEMQTEKQITDKIRELRSGIPTKQQAAEDAKKTLDERNLALKAAEDELKRKKAGLETAIDAFL